jgi:hypothetical protein
MSLPYYFLRDLNKMAMKIQAKPKTPPHGIYHRGLIEILIKVELGKLQMTWDRFLIQSGFEKEVHPPATQLHDKIVEPDQEASPSASQPVIPMKGKIKACLKISDKPMKPTPTNLQADEGSSHILGGGKHPFPYAQKTYSKKTKSLAKPRVLKEDQEPEITEEFVDHVQPKDYSTKIIPPISISFEDDASRYKILIRKRSTRPRNKFRLKSKAMYNPAIKDKVIIIDEESANPKEEPSTSKKILVTKPKRDKYKKGGLTSNKNTPTGKDSASARKQSKRDKKGPNPTIRSEGYNLKRIQNRSQTKQTRRNNLDLLAEAATSVFQEEFAI